MKYKLLNVEVGLAASVSWNYDPIGGTYSSSYIHIWDDPDFEVTVSFCQGPDTEAGEGKLFMFGHWFVKKPMTASMLRRGFKAFHTIRTQIATGDMYVMFVSDTPARDKLAKLFNLTFLRSVISADGNTRRVYFHREGAIYERPIDTKFSNPNPRPSCLALDSSGRSNRPALSGRG